MLKVLAIRTPRLEGRAQPRAMHRENQKLYNETQDYMNVYLYIETKEIEDVLEFATKPCQCWSRCPALAP
jgi:hypothetical protein